MTLVIEPWMIYTGLVAIGSLGIVISCIGGGRTKNDKPYVLAFFTSAAIALIGGMLLLQGAVAADLENSHRITHVEPNTSCSKCNLDFDLPK